MRNVPTALPLLGLAIWLTTSACGPGRAVQRYRYLTEDAEEYLPTDERNNSSRPAPERPVRIEPSSPEPQPSASVDEEITLVIQTAMSYEGTPYQYGGMTSQGMDCSGLICTSYSVVNRRIPRTTSLMASEGRNVPKRRIEPGHVLLFSAKGGNRIDHAGLVVAVNGSEVSFIHATTSAGVRVDQLSNPYWEPRFRKAVEF